MKKIILATSLALATTNINAVLGPIPIYMNAEYRTDSPVIGSITSALSFTAEDIKATGANTFLNFLETVPSVGLVSPQGNVPAIFMRGSESRHTLVLVDGVKINPPNSTDGAVEYGLTSIALNDIEKVEIIKGAGSVLYGSSAIAGVISITTKKSADSKRATISTKFGTHNSRTYTLSASSGSKEGFVRFTHNKYSTDGINVRTGDTTGEKDGVSNRSTQIKVGNKAFDISYLVANNKTEYDIPATTGTFATPLRQGLGVRNLTKISTNINKKINDTWKAKLSLSQIKSSRHVHTDGVLQSWSDKDYKNTTITLLNDIKVNDALLNIGLSKVSEENTTDKKKLSSQDLFINWQKNINSFDANVGARYIKHDEFDNHTIYNAGIAKYLNNGIKLTANYNTAFNAPVLAQYDYGATGKLNPETSKNLNIGLSKQHSWGETNIELYKSTVIDKISYAGTYPNDYYENNGQYISKGVELSANTNIAGYTINFNHNYNKSRIGDATTQSIRRPKNTTVLTVNKPYGKFNSQAQVIKKSSSLDRGNIEMQGYTLLNLSTNYDINKNVKASLNIKNATNKDYTTAVGFRNLGRTIELGLDYRF
ncbi:MAG: Vitamin B12 transporter BtuB [Catillopecten margaritatus gill symbiont]|uniref:Vitamin B12 transporter BtuB n=1 Tax=Catillopecten margaritatus gill symbiont TaxID=3083288 RepID=A0AAU6PII4_9GAMM